MSFVWRGQTFHVEVIGRWHERAYWWDLEKRTNRYYYRVVTRDFQAFELCLDVAKRPPLWVLDVIQG